MAGSDSESKLLDGFLAEESLESDPPAEDEQRRVALQFMLDAWDEAVAEGVDSDILATTAIFAALSDMIESYGEEPVAEMAEGLAERVRRGEFTLNRTTH